MTQLGVLDLFADEYDAEALAEVAKDHGHRWCGGEVGEDRIYERDATNVECRRCGWSQLFSAEILHHLKKPISRRLAYERSKLAETLRNQEIVADVRSAPASEASSDELKAEAKQALEDRDSERGVRVIAQIMDPRRKER